MQALRFGARFFVGTPVVALETAAEHGDPHTVVVDDGTPDGARIRARAVVVASGASYRRLDVESVERWSVSGSRTAPRRPWRRTSPAARSTSSGGGNSAGQAAVHLSRFAKQVTIVVRRDGLAETMSDYLVREVNANPRIELRPRTQVVGADGEGWLQGLTLRGADGHEERVESSGLVLLLGAEPCADYLPDEVARDSRGFVVTGRDVPPERWRDGIPPAALETTVPGIFAAGDIRSTR